MLHDERGFNFGIGWDKGMGGIEEAARKIVHTLDKNDPVDRLIADLLSESPGKRPTMDEVVRRFKRILPP